MRNKAMVYLVHGGAVTSSDGAPFALKGHRSLAPKGLGSPSPRQRPGLEERRTFGPTRSAAHRFLTKSLAACLACVFAAIFLTIAGCGSQRPETVAVRGRVLFDGQPPPREGMVYFAPLEPAEGFPRRPGRAEFDAQGDFRATTFDGGDGLIPGRYRVGIDCWETLPQAEGPPAKSLVPAAYREPGTSGLELVVEPGARSLTVEFNVRASSP